MGGREGKRGTEGGRKGGREGEREGGREGGRKRGGKVGEGYRHPGCHDLVTKADASHASVILNAGKCSRNHVSISVGDDGGPSSLAHLPHSKTPISSSPTSRDSRCGPSRSFRDIVVSDLDEEYLDSLSLGEDSASLAGLKGWIDERTKRGEDVSTGKKKFFMGTI